MQKKFWIPAILIALLAVMVYGLFYEQKKSNQEPMTNTVEIEQPTTQKPPPPGETAESGHWHGDVWHAKPHETHTPVEPPSPSALTAQTQVSPLDERPNASKQGAAPLVGPVDVDRIKAAYEALRAKYPEQTNNPHPFENLPVDLQDFEATKEAFMDHLNFYVEHDGGKAEVFNSSREIRIANAVLMNIANAADADVDRTSLVGDDSFLPFTLEQSKEIKAMHRRWRESEGYISRIDKIMTEKGVTRDEAHRISIYERLKSKGWSDEDIPAHYRGVTQ